VVQRPLARRIPPVIAAAFLLAPAGCAFLPGGEPEPVPRDCETLPAANLPPLEELLDPTHIVATLRSASEDDDPLAVTIAVHEEGDEIRMFGANQDNGASLGAWPVLLREALRFPLPDGAAPGVRVRLIPGPEGRAELEPVTFCPPILTNRPEVDERYRAQMADTGALPVAEATFKLSDLGGIRILEIEMPAGMEELELRARRALHFARFEPALMDGRRIPSTVRMGFPSEG
jgi:hypothetical protein